MKMVRWKRFLWDLTKLPPFEAALPSYFTVRLAGKEDQKAVSDVISSAFSLESSWSDSLKLLQPRLEGQLEAAFDETPIPVMVISHGQRIIAASLLSMEVDAETHLLSGPCVLAEYRNRGLGTALLYHSLKLLGSNGLSRASGICKEMAPTSKFVYKKFGSDSGAYDFDASLVGSR